MKIKPLRDRVIVQRIEEEEKTVGGIIIPDSAKEKPIEGKVMAVGDGKILDDGKVLPLNVKVGDKIHIKGHTSDVECVVNSMQINNVDVKEAKAGDSVGIKVSDRVRRGDTVHKVID